MAYPPPQVPLPPSSAVPPPSAPTPLQCRAPLPKCPYPPPVPCPCPYPPPVPCPCPYPPPVPCPPQVPLPPSSAVPVPLPPPPPPPVPLHNSSIILIPGVGANYSPHIASAYFQSPFKDCVSIIQSLSSIHITVLITLHCGDSSWIRCTS